MRTYTNITAGNTADLQIKYINPLFNAYEKMISRDGRKNYGLLDCDTL
jgi:hypothetical protein